jgi:hypothetical protein
MSEQNALVSAGGAQATTVPVRVPSQVLCRATC